MAKGSTHEDLSARQEVKPGSERSFGIVFAIVFALVALWPLTGDGQIRLWAAGIAIAFLALGFTYPRALTPLNMLWFRFGMLLHHVVTPVIMGLIFYLTVMPTGLIMRALGKDPLRRRFDADASTYWIMREPPGPAPASMTKQF
jgi:hypothetical protein